MADNLQVNPDGTLRDDWVEAEIVKPEAMNAIGATVNGHSSQMVNIAKRNILHNWYYPTPVNQRGVAGTISTAGYFIDRWRLISGSVTLTANGLTLNGTIIQVLEFAVGTNVTASVKMYSGTANASYNNSTKTFTITSSGGTIESTKLEFGEKSTIAADLPMDYGVELAKCQRYQYAPGQGLHLCFGVAVDTATCVFIMPSPVLRSNPAIVNPDVLRMRKNASSGFESALTLGVIRSYGHSLYITVGSTGLVAGAVYELTGGGVIFDANL